MAIQYYKDGEYEKASELFEKIQLTKKNAYIYYYHFQTLYELHDLDKLEKLAKKQCKLFPEQQRYRIDLGFVYEMSNQIGKAEKEYQGALKEMAAKEYSIREIYSAFLSKGKREYALNALLKGRTLLNNNKLFTKEVTGIYSQLGRSDKLFEEAIALISDNDAKYLPQAEEIIQNAISASTRDPRFDPITAEELPYLDISVDVLGDAEEIDSPAELDVKRYGVIVTKGFRRGLLLPDLEGVDTVEDQIYIAKRKAGIDPDEKVKLERFEVIRHH